MFRKQKQIDEVKKKKKERKKDATPLGIEPRISGSVDQRLIHWAMESWMADGYQRLLCFQ